MKVVAGFKHTPGVHCGSTALRDLFQHIGLDYDEELCFGLGSGIYFFYYTSPQGEPPSHRLYARTLGLERDACAHLALDLQEGADGDAAHAWVAAKEWIDRDIPLLLHVELSRLPYYRTRTPFPGHRVVLAGYDDARQVALLADTAFPGLQEVSYAALQDARTAKIPPIPLHNEWLAVKPAPPRQPLVAAVRQALHDNALGMNLDRTPYYGIMGMESLAEDFGNWAEAPDWEICARFAYQNIEVRGTGGSAFRRMYARFLHEAEEQDEQLRGAGLAETMDEIANEWSGLAAILERIATEHEPALFKDAGRATRRLALREENFWGRVLNLDN